MAKLLRLAWRDVWRNRRRSLLTIGAIVFAVVITAVTRSMQYGAYDAMEAYAVRLFTGDVQIHRAGYQEDRLLTQSLRADEQDWEALLGGRRWVTAYARRLSGYGLVSSDSSSAGSLILGVEPVEERRVSTFADRAVAGRHLEAGDTHAALLGEVLARNLRVGVGDTVAVLTQGFHNQMGADLFVVKGLLRTGSIEVDRAALVLPLSAAQSLFSMDGRFTEVVLQTDDYRRDGEYARRLQATLDAARYEVMDWGALLPELRQAVLLDNVGGVIMLAFLLVLLSFEIFNTTMMSVMERMREFGVLQALGLKSRQLTLLVLLETLLKIVLALAIGLGISFVLALAFQYQTLPLGEEFVELTRSFGFPVEEMTLSTRPAVFIEPLVSVLGIALLAMLYPVLRVRHLTPVEALRTV